MSEEPSSFVNWYALYAMPLGIDRENARLIYELAIKEHRDAGIEQADLVRQALANVIDEVERTLSVFYSTTVMSHGSVAGSKLLVAMNRLREEVKRIDSMGLFRYNAPLPEAAVDNIINSARMNIPGA